jgi:hypothetical protein
MYLGLEQECSGSAAPGLIFHVFDLIVIMPQKVVVGQA